jgi:tRNA (cytidine32/uridine32-2'-O)-methyltransferase
MRTTQLEIVLVNPETPQNVGAVARACRNFGVENLCIVGSPGITLDGAARAMAHACTDLLDRARCVDTLEEALAPHAFALGTANRVRKTKLPPLKDPREVLPVLAQASTRGTCAIVFGCESRGLTDVDLARCTLLLRIPTAIDQPSLNLSQAVLSVVQDCWRWAEGIAVTPGSSGDTTTDSVTATGIDRSSLPESIGGDLEVPPTVGELEVLLRHAESLMGKAGFRPYAGDPETFRLAARRSLSRANFERRDLRTLLTMLKTLDRLEPPTEGLPRSRKS